MIKAVFTRGGRKAVALGLSGENITRLVAGEPILMRLDGLGIELDVLIDYGRTEEAIAAAWEKAGNLPAGSMRTERTTDE